MLLCKDHLAALTMRACLKASLGLLAASGFQVKTAIILWTYLSSPDAMKVAHNISKILGELMATVNRFGGTPLGRVSEIVGSPT
jgi:hypothetical protein